MAFSRHGDPSLVRAGGIPARSQIKCTSRIDRLPFQIGLTRLLGQNAPFDPASRACEPLRQIAQAAARVIYDNAFKNRQLSTRGQRLSGPGTNFLSRSHWPQFTAYLQKSALNPNPEAPQDKGTPSTIVSASNIAPLCPLGHKTSDSARRQLL
jgi:hypothetical protein